MYIVVIYSYVILNVRSFITLTQWMVLPPEDTTWPLPRTERVRQCSWCYQKVCSINDKRAKLFFLRWRKRFSLKSGIGLMLHNNKLSWHWNLIKCTKIWLIFFYFKVRNVYLYQWFSISHFIAMRTEKINKIYLLSIHFKRWIVFCITVPSPHTATI